MASRKIIVPAGPGEGPVADLRGLKGKRSYMWSIPEGANLQIALSGDQAGPFIPQNTLRLNLPTGSVSLDNAADWGRVIRPANNVTGAGTIFVSADPAEGGCGGGGSNPVCDLPLSGSNNTTSNETVTVGTLLFPSDGTYTVQWTMTGREISTNKAISAVVASTYKVVGAVAAKVSETLLTDVDEPMGFGAPVSNALAGGAAFEITGKAGSPAAWVVGGCAQMNGGQVFPPP